jgi:hypothetical protein
MPLNEYQTGTAFTGVSGRTTDESAPAWPQPPRPVPGSPNVLMIVLDDTGFGQLGCYGSPIATPNFDALAERERGDLDNTIVMVISDNGASAHRHHDEAQFFNNAQEPLEDSLARIDEIGGPTTFDHYPRGWTWAADTPFRRWKRETDFRVSSPEPVPAGAHELRFEFEPTGEPDFAHGRGTPGRM